MNLPWTNFTMATYCLSPPGSFYRVKFNSVLANSNQLNEQADNHSYREADTNQSYLVK